MPFRKIIPWLAAAVLFCLVSTQLGATGDAAFDQIDSIVKSLSEITGLSEIHSVPYGRMSKKQLRHFLDKRIRKSLKPEEISADQLALKMFGFVPQDFDLRRSTVELLTEQAAAFYDYDEKKLFLMDDTSVSAETVTLAHELSHALADQHFHLGSFMDDTPSNDDENLAHSAVVEGEASWLMVSYSLKKAGQDWTPTPEMLRSVAGSGQESMADYPVLKNSPLYIQQSLLFPYSRGVLFFDAVYKKLGKRAFSAVFTDPPTDSAQIIHPERYFAQERPTHPDLPQFPSAKSATEITEGSVGEFDHEMLLRQFVNKEKAESLAPHLRGGQFRIVSPGKDAEPILQYSSEWDSVESASAYFAAYQKILIGKWKRCDLAVSDSKLLAGSGDHGRFITRLSGRIVTSLEGLSDVAEWERLRASKGLRHNEISRNGALTIH